MRAGWEEFLRLAPLSGLAVDVLDEAGAFWWHRSIPRNLLSAVRPEGQAPASRAA
jgi:hypothetical protein